MYFPYILYCMRNWQDWNAIWILTLKYDNLISTNFRRILRLIPLKPVEHLLKQRCFSELCWTKCDVRTVATTVCRILAMRLGEKSAHGIQGVTLAWRDLSSSAGVENIWGWTKLKYQFSSIITIRILRLWSVRHGRF